MHIFTITLCSLIHLRSMLPSHGTRRRYLWKLTQQIYLYYPHLWMTLVPAAISLWAVIFASSHKLNRLDLGGGSKLFKENRGGYRKWGWWFNRLHSSCSVELEDTQSKIGSQKQCSSWTLQLIDNLFVQVSFWGPGQIAIWVLTSSPPILWLQFQSETSFFLLI